MTSNNPYQQSRNHRNNQHRQQQHGQQGHQSSHKHYQQNGSSAHQSSPHHNQSTNHRHHGQHGQHGQHSHRKDHKNHRSSTHKQRPPMVLNPFELYMAARSAIEIRIGKDPKDPVNAQPNFYVGDVIAGKISSNRNYVRVMLH